ncbi:glycosyltransferase family 4 protein [Patescibacteria group bacterium]|nr:glycosyltransferase family 4 protein [Patescibacteria group bacterium]
MKKKVVFIINNFVVGGVELFIRELWTRLDHSQVEVSVISVWGSGVLVDTYKRLSVPIYWAGSRLIYNSKNPLLKLYFTIISPITFLRLVGLLRVIKPTAVLTCLTQADLLGIPAAYLSGVPRRIIRQADVKSLQPIVKWLKRKISIRLATKVVANSVPTGEFVHQYFKTPKEKIVTIPNGIELSKFGTVATQDIRATVPTIGFLGRLESIKGIQYLIDALCILKQEYGLTPKTLVFGDGSLRSQLEEKTSSNNLSSVEFRGETLDSVNALSEIDILVVPSVSEGFGFVFLEGLAAARAVVASNLPSFRSIMGLEEAALLFPVANSPILAKTLADLLKDPALMTTLQNKARSFINGQGKQYDLAKTVEKYQVVLLSAGDILD